MDNVTQKETSPGSRIPKMSVKLAEDCWAAVRQEAFDRRSSMGDVLAEIVRQHYGLSLPAGSQSADDRGMVSAA